MSAHRGDVLSYTHCLSHRTEVSQGLSLPCTSQDPSRLTPSVQRIPEIIKQVIQIPPDSWQSVLCHSYGQCMSKGRGPRQAVRLAERRATDPYYWVGQEARSGVSVTSYRKTQRNFLANPVLMFKPSDSFFRPETSFLRSLPPSPSPSFSPASSGTWDSFWVQEMQL